MTSDSIFASRRQVLQAGTVLTLASSTPLLRAQQAAWPVRPVKMVVGAPPGGPSDFLGRMMADGVGPGFGQAFVIENKPGASGVPAAERVVRSPAVGHTLRVRGPAAIVANPQPYKAPYDPIKHPIPIRWPAARPVVRAGHSLGPPNSR